ncbi:MAG: O-antigen ligase family protein [Verrucomicrobiota bacterium]|nr:O-antigen ligase family protein [Verrucomicrobiota bacterium]
MTRRFAQLIFILVLVLFPLMFWSRWTTGPGTTLYDGSINSEIVSFCGIAFLSLLFLLGNFLSGFNTLSKNQVGVAALVLGYLSWLALTYFWSASSYHTLLQIVLWSHFVGILAISALFLKVRRWLLLCALVWATIIFVPTIYLYFANGQYVPYLGLGLNRSIAGECLIVITPFLMWNSIRIGKPLISKACFVTAFLSYTAIVMLGQRAPLYGLWAGLTVLILILLYRGKFRTKIFIWCGIIIFLPLLVSFGPRYFNAENPGDLSSRVFNITQSSESADYRALGIGIALEQWKSAPITGTGAGSFPIVHETFRAKFMDNPKNHSLAYLTWEAILFRAHCEPAQQLGETGLIGFLLWASLLFGVPAFAFFQGFRGHLSNAAIGAGLVAFSISSLASSFGPRLIIESFLWFIFAGQLFRSGKKYQIQRPYPWIILCPVLLFTAWYKINEFMAVRTINKANTLLNSTAAPDANHLLELYEYALLKSPGLPMSYASIALMTSTDGHLTEAAPYYNDARLKGYQNGYYNLYSAYASWRAGNKQQALEIIDLGLRQYPANPAMIKHFMVLLEASGKFKEASDLNKTLNADQRQAVNWEKDLLLKMLRGQRVELSLDESMKLSPDTKRIFRYIYPGFVAHDDVMHRQMDYLRRTKKM